MILKGHNVSFNNMNIYIQSYFEKEISQQVEEKEEEQ